MEKKNSEYIDEFIKFLKRIWKENASAQTRERDADSKTQDILHRIELHDDDEQTELRLVGAVKAARRDRRDAKDRQTATDPIITWMATAPYQDIVKSLQQLSRDVKEAERSTEDRHYIEKTNIIKRTLGTDKERKGEDAGAKVSIRQG